MVYRIGIDLVDMRRIEKIIKRFQRSFCEKIFSLQEQKILRGKKHWAAYHQSVAGYFAGKEAFFKALSGFSFLNGSLPLSWKSVEILKEPSGRPYLAFSSDLAKILQGITWDISITHEYPYAQATVIGVR